MFGLKYLYSLVLPADKERPEIIQEGRRSKWGSKRTLPSPSLTSEPQLHIERLSLKSTWGPAEQLFSKPGCKERSTQSWGGREGGEAISSGLPLTAGGHRGGEYHRRRDPPWGTRTLNHVSGTSSPWVWHGEDEPAWLAWAPVGFPKGSKRLRLHS